MSPLSIFHEVIYVAKSMVRVLTLVGVVLIATMAFRLWHPYPTPNPAMGIMSIE